MKRNYLILLATFLIPLCSCSKVEVVDSYLNSGESRIESSGLDAVTGTLPVISITTADGKGNFSKARQRDATLEFVNEDQEYDVKIKGRGNSSWTFPKKPFNITFTEPVSFLGMNPSQKWCFLANWRDPTLMRNAVSLEMARLTSLDWTPEGRFAEVVLDGVFMGNYYVTEKVEIAEGRVDAGPDGLLICFDGYYDDTYHFKTETQNLPTGIILKGGAALDRRAFENTKQRINGIEKSICVDGSTDGIDVDSFCDWLLVHELTGNDEPCNPHSCYMHTNSAGILVAGPAWDFDFHTFRPGVESWVNRNALWYGALTNNPEFQARLKERYVCLRPVWEAEIPAYIDSVAEVIGVSARQDNTMWPKTVYRNGDETLGFDEAVIRMKEGFRDRMLQMDGYIGSL